MTDHSTSVSHTQTATAGGGATIIQIFGDNNSVSGPKPVLHVHAPSPEPPSPQSLEQDVNTAAMLQPGQESTAFIGRNDLIDGFQHWATTHHADKPVSVRVLHGKAGVGKTRFGLELCRRLNATAWPTNGHESSLAWKAGFVSSDEAIRFMNQTNLVDWGWNTPTLLVFDYALTMADVLKKWLAQLCTVRTSRFPLRIILLERHADKDSGWLERVFASGFIGIAPHGPSALLDTAPIRLPGLNDITAQRAILQAMLDRLRSTVSLPADDDTLKTILHKTDWTAAPLYLMMAAMVMHEQGGLHHILSLRRTDLAMKIAEHERKRFTHGLHEESASTTFLCHIAAFATLCGGIASEHVKHIIQQEKEQLVFDSVDTAMLTTHIKQILPGEDNGIAPIQPDIVGEAFVLCNLANHDETGSTKAAISAFDYAPRATAVSLIRTIQDFASTTGGTPPQEQTRALHWIEAVGNREDLPLPMLQELVASLPDDTHALRVQAAAWQERIVKHVQLVTPNPARGWLRRLLTLFRKKNRNEILSQAEFARNLQNLAVRYGDLGRHQQALEASEEAVT
ncbi:hypothetical protein, partial [Desulfovibrio inopinatus]|uniref:hypothetical protein n=1 Tax=Desulfovibrio inopinatus TaxID=102109 RepID=UPI00054E49AA